MMEGEKRIGRVGKGDLVVLETQSYSGSGYIGLFKALAEFDIQEQGEVFDSLSEIKKGCTPERDWWDQDSFVAWLTKAGYIGPVPHRRLEVDVYYPRRGRGLLEISDVGGEE